MSMIRSLLQLLCFLHVICLPTVRLTLIDGVCSFSFLKQPCRKRPIMAIYQDDNVKIHQAQIVKEWLGSFSLMNRLHWVQTLNAFKVFGMCWRILYRAIINTRSWPKMDAPFDGNNITCFFQLILPTILSQSEPDESLHCHPGIWPLCVFLWLFKKCKTKHSIN